MKLQIALTASLIAITASAAVPLPWTVETSRVQPASFDAYHGEALEFIARFNTLGKPLALDSHTATLYYQTNGMDQAWWSVPASVSGNVARATFTPAMDPCAPKIVVFIGVSDGPSNLNYRATANVRFLNSPGANPGWIEPPVVKLDFSQIETLNAPWFTKDESNGRYYTKTETNTKIASATNGLESAAHAAQTYQAKGQYLTSESDPTVDGKIEAHDESSSAHGDIRTAIAGKQSTISDLATIRSGAAAGATAVQPAAISDMETRTHAAQAYQPAGQYLTNESDPTVDAKIASAISPLETSAHAAQTYQPKGSYLTTESDPSVDGKIEAHDESSSAHGDIRTALAGKQATISDLASIRSGAAAGATAVQSLEPATNYTDAKFDVLSSGIAEATNHLDLSIQDKFSQHKPTAVISENPDYYRQGRAGEMGYGYAWEVLSGDGRQRFAAYAPKVSPRITLSSIDGDYDPLINHYGSLYTVSNTISEVTAIAEEDATIQAYYHQVDVSYSSTNDIPIIYHVHRNILSGVAELTDVSVSGGSYVEFEDDGVWHNVYGIYSSGTNITYTDEYYDGSTWQYAERQLVVSLDDTTPAEYERIIFGGVNIVTDITKGDSISVLTERTGKPGDCGTGWGYKVFEFATDVRSWRVNVPNLTCSAVSTNTTQIRDSTYLSHYADPFYANPNALRSLTEPVRTEGKYSSDGCSNVDYKVTFYPDTLGHNPTNELVFIASGVSITNGIVSLRPVEDSRWTLTHSGNEHHGWVYHPSFVVRSTRGNQHTYNVNITDIPCEADGTIYPTRVGSLFEIKFHHTSGTDVFRFSVGGLISKTFAAYKLVNTEDQHLYYDEGLKCTWELAVTNGCFFGTRVSNDDYRRAD